jgi:hypothetical protein
MHEGVGPFAWKVIGRYGRNEAHREPSQVGDDSNFCRLCDLRSREVCLYRAPVFSGTDRWLNSR